LLAETVRRSRCFEVLADVECDVVKDVLRLEALFAASEARSTMSIGFKPSASAYIAHMKRLISQFRKRSFLQGFLRGLSSPAEIYRPYRHVATKRSPTASMRRDWEMIGSDFRSVIARELGDATARSR